MSELSSIHTLDDYHFFRIAFNGRIEYIKTLNPYKTKEQAEWYLQEKLTEFTEISKEEYLRKNKKGV